ncbi:MAG: leucine--tRNA ligase [Lutibacter sp.]
MEYDFRKIEHFWQNYWAENQTFKADNVSDKPKYYVLDMFPYPSGAGLHVGHPLGYIASDIYARYKRHKGFNVLHPQGYDSFGLPAEQYAIQTGQHPAITTEKNIKTYRSQLDKLGFSFDWSREIRTSNPNYYKWTQWIFIQLFNSWYNKNTDKAEDIESLIQHFKKEGTHNLKAASDENSDEFTADDWNKFSDEEQQKILLQYRLAFLSETHVNWCPELGTVLANDEIVNGVSERGGYPVIRKKMMQWSMRITAYAQRLLDGLSKIDWPQPLKDAQTYWIGRSEGAMVSFKVNEFEDNIDVFTTRPDTIFGVSFMTLAPEHELVKKITTTEQKEAVENYIKATAKRSELERMADVKTISGVFTGAYVIHPFTGKKIPIWIGDYVLASYGTGAVMAVPCGDQRDYNFAKKFNLPIPNIFENADISTEAFVDKETTKIANSAFLNGLSFKDAFNRIIEELEKKKTGFKKINYRLRDAVFSRQRYWGEPFPVYYKNGLPQVIDAQFLPLLLPEVEKYLPTSDGKPPLGNAKIWAWDAKNNKVVNNDLIDHQTIFPLELNTMPGWAGSSQYFNRYMDAGNDEAIFSNQAINYWQDVDLYIGGSEHATGHLLYSRFWQKFMFDKGYVPKDEYAKKLINQGMITGTSAFAYRWDFENNESNKKTIFLSKTVVDRILKERKNIEQNPKIVSNVEVDLLREVKVNTTKEHQSWSNFTPIHVDVSLVNASDELNVEGFKQWRPEFKDAQFISEGEPFIVLREVEKMSKSKFNVVNPDDICEEYGADSLRLFEMFLGPLEQSKPWKTSGISGVHNFLKKLWRLFWVNNEFSISEENPSAAELKVLHKTIKKVEEDIDNFSFNTSVSTFMIAVNELTVLKCNKRAILEPLVVLIEPYAPHIAEELWRKMGHKSSIALIDFPKFNDTFLVENTKVYPISFNGKMRFKLELPLSLSKEEIEQEVLKQEKTQQQLQGRTPKKIIVVPGKIVNIVG